MTCDIHQIRFEKALKKKQLQSFRGGIIKTMGEQAHTLMHNHIEDGLRFGYPLVQYKVIEGKAAIIAIGDIGRQIVQFFKDMESAAATHPSLISKYRIESYEQLEYTPEVDDEPHYYKICDYLPLTDDNVAEFDSLMALTDKICLIENIITGNILSFFKGIGFFTNQHITSVVTSLDQLSTIRYKGVGFRAFNLHYVTNAILPSWIGLGKSTSIGMGTLSMCPNPERYLLKFN